MAHDFLTESSEEVVGGAARYVRFASARRWVEDQEVVIHLLITLHYTSLVTASVTVVRCRKYCHNLLLMTPIIALKIQE